MKHSPNFHPAFENLPDSVGTDYSKGSTLLGVSLKYNTSPAQVRKKVASLGIPIRRAGTGYHKRKLNDNQIVWILEQDLKNLPHVEIARKLGNVITRERIRQICLAAGHRTRRERQTKILSAIEASAARKFAKQQKIQTISNLYKAEVDLKEISKLTEQCINAQVISNYRKIYGESMFPYRSPDHWNKRTRE